MTIHSKLNRRKKSKEKSNYLKKYFARNWARSPNEIEKPPIRKSREYPAMGGALLPQRETIILMISAKYSITL